MSQTQVGTTTQSKTAKTVKIPLYTQALETTHELDWADLATLDLSKFDNPDGKQELAAQLHNAVDQIGRWPLKPTPNGRLTIIRLFLCDQLWS